MFCVRSCLLALLFALLNSTTVADSKAPEGFTVLFDGTSLDNWQGTDGSNPRLRSKLSEKEQLATVGRWSAEARKHWRVDSGELVLDGFSIYPAHRRALLDVELRLEYRASAKATAAVQLRGGLIQLNGPAEQWNKVTIHLIGERLTLTINDKQMVTHTRLDNGWDKEQPLPMKGQVQLVGSNGETRWRNIFVREIPAEEANRLLGKHDSARFVEVFNGKDFTGWDGPLDNYEIKDGAIICKPKKGGNIFTKEQYDDFVARVEFKLPPGGNNGLAIRYPGKGQASVVAMCEVQVLDDTATKYAKLDPRQFNGAAYGMLAPKRGYLRPVGEWNFMEVTVKGHTIRVEVNGTRIVDGDLSKITDFMGGKPHPGKDRLSGHFGFCGHNDPVAFRHIRIKPLTKP